jgi:hypothetical protein
VLSRCGLFDRSQFSDLPLTKPGAAYTSPAQLENLQGGTMSKQAAEHHLQAAEHHEHAARHHREAAKHHEAGDHESAAHHAHTAQGHLHHATHHSAEAAKMHVEHHGAKTKAAGA